MSNYLLLIKNRLKMTFRKRSKSGKKDNSMLALYIVLGILYLFIMGSTCVGIFALGTEAKATESVSSILVMFFLIGMLIVVIFGTITMMTNIYFSKDVEFLSSLPIKSGTVFMAKLTVVYIYEMITTAAVIFFPIIALGLGSGAGFSYYITAFLAILFVPAVPMLLASLLAIPFMYVASFFKQRSAFATIAIIIVFSALMFGYYALIGSLSSESGVVDIQGILLSLKDSVNSLNYILFPLIALAKFASMENSYGLNTGVSMLVNFLIAAGFVAVLIVIIYFIASLVYTKGVTAQLENKKSTAKKQNYEASSFKKSLIFKDLKYLFRTPSFGFQCLSFVVLCPVFVFAIKFMYAGMDFGDGTDILKTTTLIVSIMMILLLTGGINTVAASAISREGPQFNIFKTLPVDPKEIVKAKLLLALILAVIPIAISTVILIFTAGIGFIDFIFLPVYAGILAYGTACVNLNNDLKHPKLDWTSPTEAVKNRKEMLMTTFLCMFIAFVSAIPPIIAVALNGFESVIMLSLLKIAVWLVGGALVFLYAFFMNKLLYKDFYYKWELIG